MKITKNYVQPAPPPPTTYTLTVTTAEMQVLRNAVGSYPHKFATNRGDDLSVVSGIYNDLYSVVL